MSSNVVLILCTAIVFCTLVDTLGSILSRKLNFNYEYLSILSFLCYFASGYFLSYVTTSKAVLLCCGLIGLFDSTVCFIISQKLKANVKIIGYDKIKLNFNLLVTSISLAVLTGFFGSLFGQNM